MVQRGPTSADDLTAALDFKEALENVAIGVSLQVDAAQERMQ
jgi:hypothetical protein